MDEKRVESLNTIRAPKGERRAWPRRPFFPAVRSGARTAEIVQILGFLQKKPSTNGKLTRSPSPSALAASASSPWSWGLAAAPGGAAAAAPPRRLPGICSPPWPRAGTRHGRRPGRRGEEGAPNRAATELEEGAATSLAGHRGRQIRLPPPRAELEAAGSGQSRRIPAAQASASAAAMEGNWKKEQERAESQASQLRRYARDRARTRGGAEQTHPRPP